MNSAILEGKVLPRPRLTLVTLFRTLLAIVACLAPATASSSDFKVRGLLDVVAAERGTGYNGNSLTRGDSPLDSYGLRVFGDATVNDRLAVFSQVVLRDASGIYVDGAYLMYTPYPARDLHVIAGKIPWAIGTYAPRTYSNKNPLIGAPLMYQYHSTLVFYDLVPSADALIAASGKGQYAVDYQGYEMGRGMPIVDDSYWDVGATVIGSASPIEYALGVTAGTPGWGSTSKDENSGKTVLGRLGFTPGPAFRFGVSAAYGPYLVQELNPRLPAGKNVGDYHQKLGMADAEVSWGHLEIRAEGAHNVWETPTVGDLAVRSAYGELKYSFSCGAFVAGRYDVLRFGKIRDSTGVEWPWDADIDRVETGVGYRFDRDVVGKVVLQRTKGETPTEYYLDGSVVAAQLSISF